MVNDIGFVLRRGGPTEAQIRESRQIQKQQRQAEARRQQQLKAIQQQARRRVEEARRPKTFDVFVIDRGGGRTPQTLSVVRTFPTRAEAERFSSEERREFADRDTPVGIRPTPTPTQQKAFPKFDGRQVTGPPPSERGRKLQSRRLELERIQKKVKVVEGKVDISGLTRGQQARVRQITGVEAGKAFTVEKGKPTTRQEFIKSIEERQKKVALGERVEALGVKVKAAKVKAITPTVTTVLPIKKPTKPSDVLSGLGTSFILKEVTLPPPRSFIPERVKQAKKVSIPALTFLLGREAFRTLEDVSEDVRAGFLGKVGQLGEGIAERPIGKVRTGFEEITRGLTVSGKVISEKRKPIEGPLVLLPVVPEIITPPVEALERTAEFTFRTAPKGLVEAGKFVISPEGKEIITEVTKTAGKIVVAEPKATGVAIGLLAAQTTLGLVRGIGKEFRERPLAVVVEAEFIGKVIKTPVVIFKGATKALRKGIFEKKIRVLEKKEPSEFSPFTEIFEPTGKQIIELKTGLSIIETKPRRLGLTILTPTQIERQLLLKPRRVEPSISIPKTLQPKETQLKFKEQFKPLTKLQEEQLRIKVIEKPRQKTFTEIRFEEINRQLKEIIERVEGKPKPKKPKPPTFVGEVFQIGGLIPPIRIKPEVTPSTLLKRIRGIGKPLFERKLKPAKEIGIPEFRPVVPERLSIFKPTGLTTAGIIGTQKVPSIISIQSVEPISRVSIESIIKPITERTPQEIAKQREREALRVDVVPKTDIKITQDVTQDIRQDIDRITVPILDFEVPRITVPKEKIPKEEIPKEKVPDILKRIKIDKKKRQGVRKKAFITEVRLGERKGDKFVITTGRKLPRNKAINKGARIVDNTTSRSFRIIRKGTTLLRDDREFFRKDKFRGRKGKTKLPPKTFVEKSKFAIDSFGERAGIPFSPSRIPRLREALAMKKQRKVTKSQRRIPKSLTTGRGRTMRFL